jgi:hypothetical protein
MMRQHLARTLCAALVGAAALIGIAARAQVPLGKAPPASNEVSVSLIQQDFSDCSNSSVKDDPNRTRGGEIWVTRGSNGITSVRVAMTVSPNTTYHFFLKCVRQLGDIRTDDEGTGMASFDFQTSAVGSTYAFDMYPEGAPAGNKFQSLTVKFP